MYKQSPPIQTSKEQYNNFSNKAERQSNFELLRIVAMLFVLIIHADFFSLGAPSTDWLVNHPISSLMRYIVQSLTLICVNVYILISGYFGININKKRFFAFMFMVLFWRIFILFGYKLAPFILNIHTNSISVTNALKLCIPGSYDWFVASYILLMFLSPMLNDFIKKHSAKELWTYTSLYVGFQVVFSWLIPIYTQFESGYSVLSFIGLYIIGAAIKKTHLTNNYKVRNTLFLYLGISVFIGIFMYLTARYCTMEYIKHKILSMFGPYNGLFVIISSIMLFLSFGKLKIQNRAINYIAKSSFAVYLFHMNPLMRCYYSGVCSYLYNNYNLFVYLLLICCFIVVVFVTSVIIDIFRRYLWNNITLKLQLEE